MVKSVMTDNRLTGVPVPGAGRAVVSTPGDAMMSGIHSDLRVSSKHKTAVSGVLHLKRESGGRAKPSAYKGSHSFKPKVAKAFKAPK